MIKKLFSKWVISAAPLKLKQLKSSPETVMEYMALKDNINNKNVRCKNKLKNEIRREPWS